MGSNGIAVVGSGYVGTVVAACLASLGHSVVGVEIDPSRLSQLEAGRVPFYEPGLEVLLTEQLEAGTLSFTDDFATALSDASVVFLCVGTPPGRDGHPDVSAVDEAARSIAQVMRPHTVVVTKSTVTIGSGAALRTVIEGALGPHD
ncbi:MAG: nucleotide sugar dehydrogenase, partial [Acidimicrobiia bacterium]|nr:nucleotide sugar dehydrogenase [Acidimicrobiia bacterium]